MQGANTKRLTIRDYIEAVVGMADMDVEDEVVTTRTTRQEEKAESSL